MLKEFKKQPKLKTAFSVVELMLTIGLFSIMFTYIGFYTLDTLRFQENNRLRVEGVNRLTQIEKLMNAYKQENWKEIIINNDGSNKTFQIVGDTISIVDGTGVSSDITSWFTIEDATRDASGNLTASGSYDFRTKKITVNASWEDFLGSTQSIQNTFYINDWNLLAFEEDIETDFTDGTFLDTLSTVTDDGEVELSTVLFADWCEPQNTTYSFDLPGNGVAKNIHANAGHAYMGTNQSGDPSFIHTTITDSDSPNVILDGTFNGYNVKAVYSDDQYAYLATTDNSKEIVILDITVDPYVEIGHFNAPGNRDGESVYVSGNYGFMTQNEHLRIFDLSNKTGSRPELTNHRLFRRGTFMEIKGNYAYILIAGAVEELEIVDISDPLDPQTTGWVNVNSGVAVTALKVNDAEDRIYIGANSSSQFQELFTVDITSKVGERPITGSYEAGSMNVRSIEVVENDSRVIIVGQNGQEYQVIDTTNPESPFQCGGLDFDSGVNGLAAVLFTSSGNAYTYVVTNDNNDELKVIRGGEGGGGVGGTGYIDQGVYTSSIIDTQSPQTRYSYFIANIQVPTGTSYRMQFRSGNTSDLSAQPWVGPDGTNTTFFTESSTGTLFPNVLNNNQYIQYQITLFSDGTDTPVVEDITLFYQ